MKKSERTSSVGYASPPKAHQFRPGQSGNPSGRPKGVRSFKSDLREELDELVSVSDGDKTVEVTKQRAIMKAIVAAAVKGDLRAANTLLTLCGRLLTSEYEPSADDIDIEDQAIAEASEERRRKRGDANPSIANDDKDQQSKGN